MAAAAPPDRLFLSVDIGTGSARAALFHPDGTRASPTHTHALTTHAPRADHYEQSSEQVWRAICSAARGALSHTPGAGPRVAAVGFAATCSLVAVDAASGGPVCISEGDTSEADNDGDVRDIVLWMDHRAAGAADALSREPRLSAVAAHFGGTLPAEGQPARLKHLQGAMRADAWDRAAWFDLADWAAWRCTGGAVLDAARSACPAAAKWGWGCGGAARDWDATFWADAGLRELAGAGGRGAARRIAGRGVVPSGGRLGRVSAAAGGLLGLGGGGAWVAGTMVDAHAGAVALLAPAGDGAGARLHEAAPRLCNRLALVCGTSTCMLACRAAPTFVRGVWGPFPDAVVAGAWATEGGQSATGALVEYVVGRAAASAGLGAGVLGELERRAGGVSCAEVHVLPYFHGNRSPRADASLRGGVVGLRMATGGEEELVLVFRATLEALALGARHVVREMNRGGHELSAVVACGGLAKSGLYLQLVADALRMPVFTPREEDAVLGGAAMLAAAACEGVPVDERLMQRMSSVDGERVFWPREDGARYMDRKFRVFLRMYDDFVAYRGIMAGEGGGEGEGEGEGEGDWVNGRAGGAPVGDADGAGKEGTA